MKYVMQKNSMEKAKKIVFVVEKIHISQIKAVRTCHRGKDDQLLDKYSTL